MCERHAIDGIRYAPTAPPPGDVHDFWRDEHGLPSWLQIDFNGQKAIDEIDVFTLRQDILTQADPSPTDTFNNYGVTAFDVQYWTGSAWQTVPGGSITNNNLVWKKLTFTAVTTSKIRVMVNAAVDGIARICEVEAWGTAASGGSSTANINWLVADQLGTPRMVFDKTGSLTGTKRHDYLPFGEDIFAGTGSRTTAQGYQTSPNPNDGVRQKFTLYERDIETGLDFAQARYYSNAQGRFAGTDPYLPMADSGKEEFFKRYLKQSQNWNRYAYCINNPLIFIDPSGLGWYVKKGEEIGHPTWFDDDKVDRELYEGVQAFVYKNVENGKFSALNPFKNEGQDFDTSGEAMAMYQGYVVNEALGDAPRLPDAVQLGGGLLFAGTSYTFDAYGQSYASHLDVYPRRPMAGLKFRAGVSFNFVWLDQATIPTPAESRNAFTGPSFTLQGGYWGGGQYSFGGGANTIGLGVTTPGVGAVVSPNSVQAPNHSWRWR